MSPMSPNVCNLCTRSAHIPRGVNFQGRSGAIIACLLTFFTPVTLIEYCCRGIEAPAGGILVDLETPNDMCLSRIDDLDHSPLCFSVRGSLCYHGDINELGARLLAGRDRIVARLAPSLRGISPKERLELEEILGKLISIILAWLEGGETAYHQDAGRLHQSRPPHPGVC